MVKCFQCQYFCTNIIMFIWFSETTSEKNICVVEYGNLYNLQPILHHYTTKKERNTTTKNVAKTEELKRENMMNNFYLFPFIQAGEAAGRASDM